MAADGVGALWVEERTMAAVGGLEYAQTKFEHHQGVLHAGVLFSIPALVSQGLYTMVKSFNPLPAGFYGLHHMILLMLFMALCRIKNPEQLKKVPCGEMGKILGLDRIPQVEHFRHKIKQITDQNRCDILHQSLSREWMGQMTDTFFYIDGHVRVYSGELARLPKRFVSREKLCLSATTEFYVNTFQGLPLMVITGELNEKLKDAILLAIVQIKKEIPAPMIFDREAYQPQWFHELWMEHRVAVISYRKNVKDMWDQNMFHPVEIELNTNRVSVHLCEQGSLIQGHWFREVRKLLDNGHQTAILTTHPSLDTAQVAAKMFVRWSQENFLKYMTENFDFDRMIQYGTESLSNQQATIPNPRYKALTAQLKKTREKCARMEAKLYQKMGKEPQTQTLEQIQEKVDKNSSITDTINSYKAHILYIIDQRKQVPVRIKVENMPPETRYNKLKTESKKLKNAVLMIAYRAESSMHGYLQSIYKNNQKDGRQLLKEIFTSDADLIPDYDNGKLRVRLHSLSTPRANKAAKELCAILNQTQTVYPFINLVLSYETVAD